MATNYTDGNIIADSFLATIGGQVFVVNNLTLNVPQVAAERNNEKGVLAAKRSESDFDRIGGTCELQIAASANNIKLQFEEFDVPALQNPLGVAFRCVIEAETAGQVVNESQTRTVEVRALPPDAMVVEGAGTAAANDVYLRNGDANDKPKYGEEILGIGFSGIDWSGSSWDIGTPLSQDYFSNEDVSTPDLVGTWELGSGDAPVPTVRRADWSDFIT